MKSRTFFIALLIMLVFPPRAFTLDIPLTYVEHPAKQVRGVFNPVGYQRLIASLVPPAGQWKLPMLESMQPVFMLFVLGDTELLIVLDVQSFDDTVYNRIYFDANRNGDLTDDPPVDGNVGSEAPGGNYCSVEFGAISTHIEVDGIDVPYCFQPLVSLSDLRSIKKNGLSDQTVQNNVYFNIRTLCSYEGECEINGQPFRILLGDADCNGRFNNTFSMMDRGFSSRRTPLYTRGDHVYVTDTGEFSYVENQVLGDRLVVGGSVYDMAISTTEGKITLTPFSENLVPLNLTMAVDRLSIYTEDSSHCLNIFRPGKKIMVPADTYRLLSYQTYHTEEAGDIWHLAANGSNESPFVAVDGSNEHVMALGEPYAPVVDIPPGVMMRGNSQTYLSFNVIGSGGELVSDVRRVSGTSAVIPLSTKPNRQDYPKEPAYRIVKTDGEIVTQGSFEYG